MRRQLAIVLVLLAAAGSARALDLPRAAPSLFAAFDPGREVAAPRVRVALSADDEQVRLGATKGALRVLDPRGGTVVWPERAAGALLVVREGKRGPAGEDTFRVQVGAFRSEAAAKDLAARLGTEVHEPAEPHYDAERGVFRVRVGRGKAADELRALLRATRESGYPDAWIAREPARREGSGTLRLLDAGWESRPTGAPRLVFVPPVGALVTVDGKAYRGLVDVHVGADGGLVTVNEVNLEDYLRGVVPEELGPGIYPEIEALKAQAVAARTYAVGNLGQFAAESYDLCDSARCQVYGGQSVEHPLSDRAVRETAGQVLAWHGAPINALFTSTCGGHTEDVEQVFPEWSYPYLRGVACRARAADPAARGRAVTGRPVTEPFSALVVAGEPDVLPLAALVAYGLAPREAFDPNWRSGAATAGEVTAWFTALAQRAGRPRPEPFGLAPHRLTIWTWASGLLGRPGNEFWSEGDDAVTLTVDDRDAVPAAERPLVAALLARGIVQPTEDGRLLPDGVPTRGELLGWIARAAREFDAAGLDEGTITLSREGFRVRINGGRELAPPAAEPPDLLAQSGDTWHRVGRVELFAGDKVYVAAGERATIAMLALRDRPGRSDDRTSSRYRWTVVKTRAELEKTIGTVTPVGDLVDLRVLRRGVSGRVAALEVVGTEGRALVEGFRVRRALDLPETLFGIDIQRSAGGKLDRATFRGRGWGHGVGLCQVGSVGMARRGATWRQILLHYYSGVELVGLK